MDVCEIPFSRTLGLQHGEGPSEVVLSPETRHLNHVGTVHAGVIYALAETAAGQALMDRFTDLVDKVVPLLRSAQTKYRSPAIRGEQLTAVGCIDDSAATQFCEGIAENGRALVDVQVSVEQGDRRVFGGRYSFFVASAAE